MLGIKSHESIPMVAHISGSKNIAQIKVKIEIGKEIIPMI